MSAAVAVSCGVLGALVGSFANVVIHRLPAGVSVVHPRSACPSCGRTLGAHELVPVLSWLLQGGRCRGCGARISLRYPVTESLAAVGFAAIALRVSPLDAPGAFVALATWWTLLLIAAWIDLDTYQIPDALTLPGIAVLTGAAWLWGGGAGLPGAGEAAWGAALGAGALTVVNRLGALVLRRLRDTRERLWPIGFDQANLAAVVGTLAGLVPGLLAAAASLTLNLATRRALRLPEPLVWGLWIAALALSPYTVGPLTAISGGLAACGAAALVGATVWWVHDLRGRTTAVPASSATEAPSTAEPTPAAAPPGSSPPGSSPPGSSSPGSPPAGGSPTRDAGDDEPVAMGFGDVKLAALLGVVLGWDGLLVALFIAVLVGAGVGVAQRLAGGTRLIPFGPFLALGGAAAWFVGDVLLSAYLGALGLG